MESICVLQEQEMFQRIFFLWNRNQVVNSFWNKFEVKHDLIKVQQLENVNLPESTSNFLIKKKDIVLSRSIQNYIRDHSVKIRIKLI